MSKVKRSAEASAPAKKVARVKATSDVSEAKMVTKKATRPANDTTNPVEEIRRLEAEVYEGKKNYNNIVTILSFCSYEKYTPQEVISASQALRRIFLALMKSKECTLRTSQITSGKVSEALSKVESWLQTQALKFIHLLVKYIALSTTNDIPDALVIAFIDTLFDLAVQDASSDPSRLVSLDSHSILVQLAIAIFHSNPSTLVMTHLKTNWITKYDDIRHGLYRVLTKVVSSNKVVADFKALPVVGDIADEFNATKFCENVFDVLLEMKWGVLSGENALSKSTASDIPRQKRQMSDLWMALLKNKFSNEGYKRVLMAMESHILPNIVAPISLCDFLTDSFNVGGVVSVLALSGLFVLMTKHNLDYPNFFPKLYAICDNTVLTARYRSRFFKLISLVLNGTYLPAYLVAAFSKRLLRLALYAPPASSAYILALVFNLVRKHPIISNLINRHAAVEKGVVKTVPMPVELVDALYRPNAMALQQKTDEEAKAAIETALAEENKEEEDEDQEEEEVVETKPAVSLFSMLKASNSTASTSTNTTLSTSLFGKTNPSTVADMPLLLSERPVALLQDAEAWVGGKDPFLQAANDPSQACALETSLLEISALCEHYCPDVSRVAKLFFADNAPKLGHNIDHFVSLTHEALINTALDYRKNRMAATNYERPQTLLGKSVKLINPDDKYDDDAVQRAKMLDDKPSVIESAFDF